MSSARPPMARLARTSQKAAKAAWMNPPMRRTRLDHAAAGVRSGALMASGRVVLEMGGAGIALTAAGLVVMVRPAGQRHSCDCRLVPDPATVAAMASASRAPD